MLQKISRVNLPSTEAAPRTEGCAEFMVLKQLIKKAPGQFGVQLRKVQLQGRAENLKIQLQCVCEYSSSGGFFEFREVIVNKERQLRENCAHMWLSWRT